VSEIEDLFRAAVDGGVLWDGGDGTVRTNDPDALAQALLWMLEVVAREPK